MNEMIVEADSGTTTSRVCSYSHNKGGESSHTGGEKKFSKPPKRSAVDFNSPTFKHALKITRRRDSKTHIALHLCSIDLASDMK